MVWVAIRDSSYDKHVGRDVPLEVAVMLLSTKISSSGQIFVGRTFNLVSQRSVNYACIVKVRHTPNARAYIAKKIYMHTPTPNPNHTHKFQHSIGTNYNSNKQPVQARYTQNTLQSCMHLLSLATHTGQIQLLAFLHSTPSSSNVTASGSQFVICTKYEIHKKFM